MEGLSSTGTNWLWAVMAIYLACFLVLLTFCFTTPESSRVFHYLLTMTLLVGALAYMTEASHLGWTPAPSSDHPLFYAKYINWAVSFPSLSLALGMLSGVSWTTILTNVFLSDFWVVSYLAAAYVTGGAQWGFFAFGTFAWLILAASTLNESREAAQRTGMARDYMVLAGIVNVTWLLYPVAFGLGDGAHVIGLTGASVFVGVLDIVQVPLVSMLFLVLSRRWDYAKLHLDFSEQRFKVVG